MPISRYLQQSKRTVYLARLLHFFSLTFFSPLKFGRIILHSQLIILMALPLAIFNVTFDDTLRRTHAAIDLGIRIQRLSFYLERLARVICEAGFLGALMNRRTSSSTKFTEAQFRYFKYRLRRIECRYHSTCTKFLIIFGVGRRGRHWRRKFLHKTSIYLVLPFFSCTYLCEFNQDSRRNERRRRIYERE